MKLIEKKVREYIAEHTSVIETSYALNVHEEVQRCLDNTLAEEIARLSETYKRDITVRYMFDIK